MATFRSRTPIQRLPVQLANQIAAGEVVERPASVVKELVENAVDAGAARIDVELEAGGERLIRVRDNGSGIACEELALALSPHATSKLRSVEDLEGIASLGFRGEALASIASVSRLMLTSRVLDQDCAWRLQGDNPEGEPEPAAHPPGTSVEVCDLFHSTPARRKFLRTQRTEFTHALEVVKRVALSRFELSVGVRHNGRSVLDVPSAPERPARERRLARIFGPGFLRHARYLEFEAEALRLWGWVAAPEFTRSQQDLQYFYVNGRSVRDRVVTHAVRRAYEGILPEGRQPAYVLYLELDPRRVDVNVHPTKHEVRFREARLVHDFIVSRLQHALGATLQAPAAAADLPSGRSRALRSPATHPVRRSVAEASAGYRALRGRPAPPARGNSGRLGRPLKHLGGFVLTETGDGLLVVDVRSAGEALFRERLKPVAGGPVAQPLLLPQPVSVPDEQARLLEAADTPLQALGFDVERAGPAAVLVRGLPSALAGLEAAPLVEAALGAAAEGADSRGVREAVARSAASQLPGGMELTRLLRELESWLAGPGAGASPFWRHLSEEALAELFRAAPAESSRA